MLATPARSLPVGDGWGYEFKWDGVRALIDVRDGRLSITSRLGNEVQTAYPELAGLAGAFDDVVLDGEIVAMDNGRPSFARLQTRMHVRDARQAAELAHLSPVTFIAFDVLRLYGVDLTGRPLRERRDTLERLAHERPELTVSPLFDDGPATEEAARAHGLEGVVAKRLTSRYTGGVRSTEWAKVRFASRQEFVVVGWSANRETPARLSSLLLGYYEGDELRYAGNAGSGLTARSASDLQKRLTRIETTPLADPTGLPTNRVIVWTQPDTVVEIKFLEWTAEGRLRFPVFLGVRTDKSAGDVVRES